MDSLNLVYKKFFQAVSNDNLEEVMDLAFDFFRRPITVIDIDYVVLHHRQSNLTTDAVFDSLWSERKMQSEIIWMLEEGSYRKYLADNFKASYVNWGNLKFPRIMGVIKDKRNNILGYFAILYQDGKCSDYELEVAEIFRQALGILMSQKINELKKQDDLSNALLRIILNSDTDSTEVIKNWTNYDPMINRGNYLIIYTSQSHKNLFYFKKNMDPLFKDFYSVVNDNDLFYIFCNLGVEEKCIKMVDIIYDTFSKSKFRNVVWASGRIFEKISDLRQEMLLAKMTYQLHSFKKSESSVIKFQKHQFDLLVYELTKSPVIKQLIHPVITEILDYDYANNTEYYHTMLNFLMCDKDYGKTSRALNIHRNSVDYRLKRIVELFNVDFKDCRLCFHLLLSMIVLEMCSNNNQ